MRIILRALLGTPVLFAGLLAIFPCVNPAPALAGTTTLITYYPAPNGNYSKVTLYPQTQPSGVCRSGAMYVDNTTGAFNYCVDSNINPNGGGLIGGVLAGTGAWGNLQTVNPVHYYDAANKGYVDAAAGPPGNWTCTVRSSLYFYFYPVYCQGTEKVINGGCSGCYLNSSPYSYAGMPTFGYSPFTGQQAEGWSCTGTFGETCYFASALCCK